MSIVVAMYGHLSFLETGTRDKELKMFGSLNFLPLTNVCKDNHLILCAFIHKDEAIR